MAVSKTKWNDCVSLCQWNRVGRTVLLQSLGLSSKPVWPVSALPQPRSCLVLGWLQVLWPLYRTERWQFCDLQRGRCYCGELGRWISRDLVTQSDKSWEHLWSLLYQVTSQEPCWESRTAVLNWWVMTPLRWSNPFTGVTIRYLA